MSKPPLQFLLASAVALHPWEDERCCDDRPRAVAVARQPMWPRRWARKIRLAVPAAFAVFRRQLAQPAVKPASEGTPVVSSSGRSLGEVRSVVVELRSGRSSYAVSQNRSDDDARVLLLPRDAVAHRNDEVVIEEQVLRRLERRSA
jgi:hypothetical protein